jgi:coronin-7
LNQAAGSGEDAPTITNLSFNYDGSAYALACKDNVVRIVDPRLGPGAAVVSRSAAGALGRNLRVEWCSDGSSACSALLTVSVGNSAMRTVNLWDPRNWSAPLHSRSIDTAAGQLYPMYDASAGVCYIVGKGDSIIRAFEINLLRTEGEGESGAKSGGGSSSGSGSGALSTTCEKAVDFPAAADRSTFTGVCMLPKSTCDIRAIECARLLKLTTTGVVPVSITLPRADHLKQYFQDDIFRPARSATQSRRPGDFRAWLRGSEGGEGEGDISPIMQSLQPADMTPLSQKPVEEAKPSRASSFRAAKEAEEKEAREKAETMARLTAMANTKASYHPNKSMGGGADEVDSDDNWGD